MKEFLESVETVSEQEFLTHIKVSHCLQSENNVL